MFSLFKKKSRSATVISSLPISVDIHSHILPGIDDGAPSLEASLELIQGLMQLGIRKSIATPHVMADIYRNNDTSIEAALLLLRDGLQKNEIEFEVHAAAEYMMDDHFFALLRDGKKLRCLHENYVLTEFPYSYPPIDVEKMAFNIISENYIPLLAHPERYGYFHSNYEHFHRMHELGFRLQLNLLSLTGYYGKQVRKAALYLIKENLICFTGTDLHHPQHLAALQDQKNISLLHDKLGEQNFNAMFQNASS